MKFRLLLSLLAFTIGASRVPTASAASIPHAPATRVPTSFAHTQGTAIIGRDGKPLLLRGTNLGNWLVPEGYMFQLDGAVQSSQEIESFFTELIGPTRNRDFWRTWRATYVTREDIHLLHQAGFNSIRVPFHYKYFLADDGEGFRLLDRLVSWARAEDMYLILDMHAAPGGQTGTNIDDSNGYPWLFNDPESQQQFLDVWQRVARHYAREPVILGYDLLNEPIPHFSTLQPLNPLLEPLYKRAVAVIRHQDPNHILILGGAQWDTNFTIFGPALDPNLIYEWHKYLGGTPDQKIVQPYVDFRQKHNAPVWLGEAGENTDAWIAGFRSALEANDMGWAFWPYKKLATTSAVVTVTPPEGWAQIVAYSKLLNGSGRSGDRLPSRPSQAVIDHAFAGLLENIQVAHCTVNLGYLRALLPSITLDSTPSN